MTQDELAAMIADLDPRRWHVRRVVLSQGRFRGPWWITVSPAGHHRIVRHWTTHADALEHATPKLRR